MAFDWQAFAGSFLNEITAGIDEREKEAEEYKEKREAAAARNAALVNERKGRASEAASHAKKAMNLGATENQVKSALSSGMSGIKEFADKLQAAANSKGIKKLGVDDIEAIVSMPNIPTVDQSLVDMSIDEFAKRTYGASTGDRAPVEQEDNIIKQLFGYGDKARVKKELAETEYMGGMSIADINEMANQAEYRSLMPEATMTFLDVEQYKPKAIMEFNNDLAEAMKDAIDGDAAEAYIQSRKRALGTSASLEEIAAAEQEAIQTLQGKAARIIIETYAGIYGQGGFFTNDLTLRQIKDTMGEKYLNDLLTTYGFDVEEDEEIEPEDPNKNAEPKDPNANQEKDPKKKEADPEAKKAEVSAKKAKFKNIYYRNDEGDIVNGVPPRPTREFSNLFFGAGMGGEDIEAIMKGEMAVPKYLRPSQWDELFGEFYNPDGTFKG